MPDCVADAPPQVVPFGRCNTARRLAHWRELAGFEECSRERDVANHPTLGRAAVHARAARALMYEPIDLERRLN